MQTVILCGGTGTRAYPHTLEMPKPLMQVGDRPILLHLMQIYARQGFDQFVLSAGYRADLVAKFAADLETGWQVEVIDTGERHGDRRPHHSGAAPVLGQTFLATYGDGLGSINVKALLEFHSLAPGRRDGDRRSAAIAVRHAGVGRGWSGPAIRRKAEAHRSLDQCRVLRDR